MMVLSTRKLQRFFDRVRSNKVFEMFVVAVILFSAVMIGVNSYALDARVASAMEMLDLAITLFFLIELSVRFLGEPQKRAFFRQGWNVFDTLIVTVSLVPADESELALLGRLIRIFRVLRMDQGNFQCTCGHSFRQARKPGMASGKKRCPGEGGFPPVGFGSSPASLPLHRQ